MYSLNSWGQCVNTFPYLDDFEDRANTPALWSTGGSASTWEQREADLSTINYTPTDSTIWATGGFGIGAYINGEHSHVTSSACFDFTNLVNPFVLVDIWWECEANFDGAVLQYSTNGGSSWQVVGGFATSVGWYNNNSINSQPGNQPNGWSGRILSGDGSLDWIEAQHQLTGLAGQSNVKFRFLFRADATTRDDGFAFDNFRIVDGPGLNLGPDTTLCLGDTLVLDPSVPTAAAYQWSTGATTPSIDVAIPGTYIAVVTDSSGIIAVDTIEVSISFTSVDLGPNPVLCEGDTITLFAGNPGADYLWTGGSTASSIDITQPGLVKLTVQDSTGCVRSDSVFVFLEIPPQSALGNDTSFCLGGDIVLDAGAGAPGTTYQWNFGPSTQIVSVSSAGLYSVVATTPNGCIGTDTIDVGVDLAPVVNLGPDHVECYAFTLDAGNPGSTYLWSTNQTSQTITSTNPGTYWVQVTNAAGCVDSDTIIITSSAPPSLDLGGDQTICGGTPIQLDAGNPSAAHEWSTGATTQSIIVINPGTYFVSVTDANGCESADTVLIGESPLDVDLGTSATICEGDPLVLDAGPDGDTYDWSTNQSTQTITVTTSGTYSVTVSDQFGCEDMSSITVTTVPNFTAGITAPDTADLFASVNFMNGSTGNTVGWLWDFGDGSVSTLQNPTHQYVGLGTYTVTLITTNGTCQDTVTHEIVIEIFTDIEDEIESSLQVYPNPNDGNFQVAFELENPQDVDLSILDLSGKSVFQKSLGNQYQYKESVNIQQLPQGLYILKVSVGTASIYRKIIIQ